jgi:hypothetical protein
MTWLRGTATLSADRAYRYLLTRRWGDGPAMCWIMLNPSTADASEDDPTIRRCIGFARREGCEAIQVVNLFALRAADPGELLASPDPIGPGGDGFLLARPLAACTVAAWGARGSLHGRSAKVTAMLAGVRLLCLGVTSSGEPKHPLYVRADVPLVPFPVSVPPARSLTFHGSAAGRVLSPAKPGGSTDG